MLIAKSLKWRAFDTGSEGRKFVGLLAENKYTATSNKRGTNQVHRPD